MNLLFTLLFVMRGSKVIDQISPADLPPAIVQQAAGAWGVPFLEGGPPGCRHNPEVLCMGTLPSGWLGAYYLPNKGMVVSPRIKARSALIQLEVVEHEIGNMLGVPEQPCGARNVMSRCVDGYVNLP